MRNETPKARMKRAEQQRLYKMRHPEKVLESERKYRKKRWPVRNAWKKNNPEKLKEYRKRERERYPEKTAARLALNKAIARGILVRPSTCSVCSIECVPHGHHADYSKPLEVVWVCTPCHTEIHHSQGQPPSSTS